MQTGLLKTIRCTEPWLDIVLSSPLEICCSMF